MKRCLSAILLAVALLNPVAVWAAGSPATTATSQAAAAPVRRAKVALLKLQETLLERPPSFGLSLSMLLGSAKPPALSNLIVTLEKATKDASLSGVVLDLSDFSLTTNQSQELGALLSNVRKAGKRVAIYSADFDTPTYLLASYADTVIMPENGEVLIPGVGMQMIFFKGTLDKLDMSADFVQVGKFKGAEEPFTRSSASPEYHQQIEKLVDGMYQQLVSTIAANRPNMDPAQVQKAIDEGWLSGKRAKQLGLIDQTMTRDKVDQWVDAQFPAGSTLVEDYGQVKKPALDLSSPFAIFSLLGGGGESSARPRGPTVAVIYATGTITGDSVGTEDATDVVTPGMMRNAVRTALDDDQVKAIVVRVDSPGGSAAASDEIWSVLKDADKKKPVTISMGQFAASGGYYISCAGRRITADPATITGSIGVVGGKVVIKGLLDKVGLNIQSVDKGLHAEMLSMLRPFTEEERTFIRKSMEEVYGVFTSRVSAARGEKVAKLEEVAQGRLFTGQQAKEVGLVDDVGTLHDAVLAAARNAGIERNYQMLVLPEAKTLSDVLREGLLSDLRAPIAAPSLKFDALDAVISALPPEVRQPTRRAMLMLQALRSEHMLMAMPAGLTESHQRIAR